MINKINVEHLRVKTANYLLKGLDRSDVYVEELLEITGDTKGHDGVKEFIVELRQLLTDFKKKDK